MTFTTYQIGKLIFVAVAALVWGIYCGLTGRDLRGRLERPGQSPEKRD